jgi:hypothetical protein
MSKVRHTSVTCQQKTVGFERVAAAPDSSLRCAEPEFGYSMLKSVPDIDPAEVELANVEAVEVIVQWGQNVLHVSHLRRDESFRVGEAIDKASHCDFFIPSEKLGAAILPIVIGSRTETLVMIPEHAVGRLELEGKPAMTLEQARTLPLCSPVIGGHALPLGRGTRVRLQIADFTIRVAAVNAAKRVKKGLSAGVDWSTLSYFGFTAGAVGGLIATMAFFMPSLADAEDTDVSHEQLYLMQQYLVSVAEREKEAAPTPDVAEHDASDHEGGTGTRARCDEGSMGSPVSRATNRRYSVAGPRDNTDPHLARARALEDARTFGTIGLLNAGLAGDPNAPTAPWGREESSGTDELSANGNLWGDELGDAVGAGGLGLTGIGEGGGGRGEGIGLGTMGGLGHGAGLGLGQGMGNGHGRLGRGHKSKVPGLMRTGTAVVNGRLPPEVIQRIVRQNYGRFRMCYEQGLARNPNLEGRVQVRFAIDRGGMVSNVQNGGSDLPDSAVTSCVMGAYYGLSFPPPEGGIVTVTYPIMFQPG